jgi:hypothetical protein
MIPTKTAKIDAPDMKDIVVTQACKSIVTENETAYGEPATVASEKQRRTLITQMKSGSEHITLQK